ncbi:hypothetical protein Tco_0825581 [Tanacetum coccineum]
MAYLIILSSSPFPSQCGLHGLGLLSRCLGRIGLALFRFVVLLIIDFMADMVALRFVLSVRGGVPYRSVLTLRVLHLLSGLVILGATYALGLCLGCMSVLLGDIALNSRDYDCVEEGEEGHVEEQEAFGGNTHDLDLIWEETGQDCNSTRRHSRFGLQIVETSSQILVTTSKISRDDVRINIDDFKLTDSEEARRRLTG